MQKSRGRRFYAFLSVYVGEDKILLEEYRDFDSFRCNVMDDINRALLCDLDNPDFKGVHVGIDNYM